MSTPTFEIIRTQKDGKPAMALIVRNATAKLREMLDGLGYEPVEDMSNMRRRICGTPDEVDQARNPLMPLVIGPPVNGRVELRG